MCPQQQQRIQETEREDLAGTTYTTFSTASKAGLTAVYDPFCNQLSLLIQRGDYVWRSEWWECENQLPTQDMEELIKEAVRLWLLRTGLHSREQNSGLTPLELAARTIAQFEHILA